MGNYEIKNLYQGGYSSLDPSKNLSPEKYPVTAGSVGLTTDPRSANILKEVSGKLSTGVKQIEIEGVSSEAWESVPLQQLDEVNRLAKLTGVKISLHGPVIDSAGFDRNGGFNELNREASERKFIDTIERGHKLDPEGNIIINFHSGEGFAGSQYEWDEEGKKSAKRLIVINRENGKMAPLEPERKYYPGGMVDLKKGITQEEIKKVERGEIAEESILTKYPLKEGKPYLPENRIDNLNHSEWDNSLNQIIFNKERADEILQKNAPLIAPFEEDFKRGKIDSETLSQFPSKKRAYNHFKNAEAYLDDTYSQINELFSKAYEFGNDKQKEELAQLSENFKQALGKYGNSIMGKSDAMNNLLHELKQPFFAPKMYVPLEEFASDQSSKTFGNTAFKSWKEFGDTAPIISIENPPAGFLLSTGEDLRNLVDKSREHFEKRLIDEENFSPTKARETAEKLIGATWDVGHINMLRKFGAEEKDILRETEKIKPILKHVHLSDNFGLEHTELPMGMGNVPIQKIMEKLGKEGFEADKIIEAGNWWQHFGTAPVQPTLEAFGSPIYGMKMAPYWNQTTGFYQGYYSGLGTIFPEGNYQTFGGSFSQLPSELGGQRAGAQGSRMSGRGME